jgi:hypothetical protein
MNLPRISLDGTWEFIHVANDRLPRPVEVRSIEVPGVWQAAFEDLRMRGGMGLYRRVFDVPEDWLAGPERVFVRFGAVFHNTRVWINDTLIGAHQGGFLPFSFEVTAALRGGENEIKLRVESPTDDPGEFPETPFTEMPFGKQSWYGPLSGVWQPVFLEKRVPEHIARVRLMPELESGRLRARIFLAQQPTEEMTLGIEVFDPHGDLVVSGNERISPGTQQTGTELTVLGVAAWSPAVPNLYRARFILRRRGSDLDQVEETFGFRTIVARDGKLYLNGELLYLRGALDQDYYPDTICSVPSIAFLEDQARKAKELGLNCLRCHIKAADPRYYDVADRMGLLIWTELPNGGLFTERSRAQREATLTGIVDRDYNHPSIICWTIINENWGIDLVHDPEHRGWLKQTYHWLKAYDPSRLVVDNSPLGPSFHVETDIADYHHYAAFPDSRADWDRFVHELAGRASWLFSPYGDAVETGAEPVMCSEFGNWGLPDPDAIRNADGTEPWWFETGHDWGEGVMYAHGVKHRFADWSLDRVFGDLLAFVKAAQWQQFEALKYEIETMRRYPSLGGYVITELTDVHWESNGLLDMRRNPRVFHEVFATINADTVIVPTWEKLSYWAGETATFDLSLAHGAGTAISGAWLTFGYDGEHRMPLPETAAGTVARIGEVRVQLPLEDTPTVRRIEFVVSSAEGAVIARNALAVAIHPQRQRPSDGARCWSPDAAIRDRLSALGYVVADGLADATVVIGTVYDAEIAGYVRNGGRLVFLPEAEGSLNPYFPHWQNVKVVSRQGTLWRGDWASTFSWLRRGKAFGHMPGGPMLDASFDRVMPTHVISGCNLLDFQGRVYAGMVIGWVHKPVALIVERPYGKGHFVASTLRLFRDPPGADPTATMLLDGLLSVATSPIRHTEGLRREGAAQT